MLPFKNIPGLEWDPVRKKYFPAGSRPPASSSAAASSSGGSGVGGGRQRAGQQQGGSSPKRPKVGDDGGRASTERKPHAFAGRAHQQFAWQSSLAGPLGAGRDRVNVSQMALEQARIVDTTYLPMPSGGSFVTAAGGCSTHVVAGDSIGSIHALDLEDGSAGWQTPLAIPGCGPISAISVQRDHFIATSFGPSPVLVHSSTDMFNGACTISRPDKATDVSSCLYLRGGGVVLGCSSHMMVSRAPLLTDFRKIAIKPRSSVLVLCSLDPEIDPAGNVVMSGLRSGVVGQYDLRTPWLDVNRQPALEVATPVVGLQSGGGWNLAVAGMNGSIEIHDLRFSTPGPRSVDRSTGVGVPARSQPLLRLPGHRNSHTTGLALHYVPRSRLLLAAGEDHVVRLWDCRDGSLRPTAAAAAGGGDQGAGGLSGRRFASAVTGVVDLVDCPQADGMGGGGAETAVMGVISGQRWDLFGS